jgi:hypothetical protein
MKECARGRKCGRKRSSDGKLERIPSAGATSSGAGAVHGFRWPLPARPATNSAHFLLLSQFIGFMVANFCMMETLVKIESDNHRRRPICADDNYI